MKPLQIEYCIKRGATDKQLGRAKTVYQKLTQRKYTEISDVFFKGGLIFLMIDGGHITVNSSGYTFVNINCSVIKRKVFQIIEE